MRLVKIGEQSVGDTALDVYELQFKEGGNLFPCNLSFESIQELPRFREVTAQMARYKTVLIQSKHGSIFCVKVKRRDNTYLHRIGDGIDIDNWAFYQDLVSIPN